jgi:PadR family transcriptional regulator, regulatory protein PadR
MKIDKGLLGGSTILLLLSLLEESDRYGYEIIKELETRSDKAFQFKEGTLYPILHKLENIGYVKSYMSKGDTGKERRYYQITKAGKKQLAEEKEKWEVFSISVKKVIGGGVNAFV